MTYRNFAILLVRGFNLAFFTFCAVWGFMDIIQRTGILALIFG